MRSICVVQARTGSSRLPGKVVMDLRGRPMLRFMLDRLRALAVDELVVATTELARDDVVVDIATGAGRPVVRGSEADVLGRFVSVLDAFPADHVVRLTADCPLSDPALVEAVLTRHVESRAEYTCNVLPRSFPKGLDVEVATADALRRAHAESRLAAEREHVMPYLYRHPELFRLASVVGDDALGHERWTVDTVDDLEFVRWAAAAVDDDDASWRDIFAVVGRRAQPAPGELVLRPASAGDAADLLAWRNDATTVRFSRSLRAVEPAEHDEWLAARLADPATRLWIGEVDGAAVGQVRVDVTDGVGVVDVAVAPERRGRGFGRALLAALRAELQGDLQARVLTASVAADNEPSARAFLAAGFHEGDPAESFRTFCVETGARQLMETTR